MTIKRHLEDIAFSDIFSRQMRCIAGPRQCGKTTIAQLALQKTHTEQLYYNWDKKAVRTRYRQDPHFFAKDILDLPTHPKRKPWVCFDEIHKMPRWKQILKDYFDTYEGTVQFIITGSAKLDMFRKTGESLAGRYFLFKLNPLMMSEVTGASRKSIMPEPTAATYIEKILSTKKYAQDTLEQMLKFSSFPEPLLKGNLVFAKKWHENYVERMVNEDIRDISSIHQLEKVLDLLHLIPSRVGSPLSMNSLAEDLELHFHTIKNYIRYLTFAYVVFDVPPYTKKLSRMIKKERKVYLYDFGIIPNEAARFENYVALELKARIDLWNEISEETYSLSFLRTRAGHETDFLILKNEIPFFLCEVKSSRTPIERHHYIHAAALGNIPFVQIVREPNILRVEQKTFFTVSATRFFS